MFQSNTVVMKAPLERIFEVTSNLENWPKLLPHYRYIHFMERENDHDTVKMAAMRGVIPISWVSHHSVDHEQMKMTFTHLKAFTKGLEVVWHYEDSDEGVKVTIDHELRFRIPAIAPVMEPIITHGFIDPVANKTLATFKSLLESDQPLAL